MVHVSELSWTKRVARASDMLKVGNEIDAVVLEKARRAKISSTRRQSQPLDTCPEISIGHQITAGPQPATLVRSLRLRH
jgi:small subunit ribosomal protein S1